MYNIENKFGFNLKKTDRDTYNTLFNEISNCNLDIKVMKELLPLQRKTYFKEIDYINLHPLIKSTNVEFDFSLDNVRSKL
jgi:two-component SAPR family response regulator